MKNNLIYLDTSASTPLDPEVYKEMHKYFHLEYGNAGSMHTKGLMAGHALNLARNKVAIILNCQPQEIIFTGSGTESINFAIKGVANKSKGKHIITSNIEHHAVLDTLEHLEDKGFTVTYIPVEKNGIVDPKKVEEAITEDTILITIMYSNNEIGTIQPIKEISKIAKKHKVLLHTDACQSGNSEELDIETLGVDLMSLNGSKIYGPKGIGCLYKREGIKLEPLIHGGGQEFNLRSGTENIPSIVGFAKALEIAQKGRLGYTKRLTELREYLINNLLKIDNTILNGDPEKRLPNNANITFLNIEGEAVLLKLDKEGICASSGSACTSKSLDPSHVILALGRPYEAAHGSIRFSLSKYTTKEGIDKLLRIMPEIAKELRELSPVNLKMEDLQNA